MLRLDPAFPPVWASPTRLQLGVEPVAVLDDPSPWQQRLLRELERGIPDTAVRRIAVEEGVDEPQVRALIARLHRALERPAAAPVRVRLEVADSISTTDAAAVADVLDAHGMLESPSSPVADPRAPVILLAHHVIDPHRSAALLREDIPHLPIVFAGSGVVVGPFVRPGMTACLTCVAFHRADADPSWPMVAAQLVGRRGPEAGRAFALEAGLAAARLLSPPESLRPVGHSLTLSTDSLRRAWRAHPPHEDCHCRSLEGIGTAGARFERDRATTTARGSGRRG